MKLKFGEENNLLEGRIGIKTVKQMLKNHRADGNPPKEKLKYAHFNAYEILDLFMDNKILPKHICAEIEKIQDLIKQHGLRIYLGQHDKASSVFNTKYLNCTTTILCNTTIVDAERFLYKDKITKEEHSLLIATNDPNDEDYLDQASICPPESPVFDEGENSFDIGK